MEASEDIGPLVMEGMWGIRSGRESGKTIRVSFTFSAF